MPMSGICAHGGRAPAPYATRRSVGGRLRRCAPVHTAVAPVTGVEQQAPPQPANARAGGALKDDVCHPSFPAPAPGAFLPDRSSFHEEHRIRGYEVQPDQRANIVTIANLLQEVASNHAVGMWGRNDSGFANLPSMKDIIFVMTRLQIRMLEYPKWGDVVRVETYFTEEGRLAARRDWVMTNAATGRVLGGATSTWVTINIATRKLTKLPDDLKARFMQFSPRPPRHAIPVGETKRKLEEFPALGEPGVVRGPQQGARRADMDMNGHINNVTYLAWALEGLPVEAQEGRVLCELEVDFKAECRAGEKVDTLCHMQGSGPVTGATSVLHSIRRCVEGGTPQEIVRCRTHWRPVP